MKTYSAQGYVLGKLWGGGEGFYPSAPLNDFETKKKLKVEAERMLKDGSLDSGMGFEYLKGAGLYIKETETIEVEGKTYSKDETEVETIGKLNADELERLDEITMNE